MPSLNQGDMDEVEDFLRGSDIVRQMVDASNRGRPADNDQMRQWTGKMAKKILDENNYEVVEKGVYLPENCSPFSTATRYKKNNDTVTSSL